METGGSGPSAASCPHRLHVPIARRLLIGRQDRTEIVQLVTEQCADLLPRGRVRRTAGVERRHLLTIVRLDRVDLRLLRGRQRYVLEQNFHASPWPAVRGWRVLCRSPGRDAP